jgi:hypothetical protein
MASNTGIVIIDFGTYPGTDYVSRYVFDSAITGTAYSDAYIQIDSSVSGNTIVSGTDHTWDDHRYLASFASFSTNPPMVGNAGFGFMTRIVSNQKLTGTFQINWVWSD